MKDWFHNERWRRHAVQRSFERLKRRDLLELGRWRDGEGLTEALKAGLGPPRESFLRAVVAPGALDPRVLIERWTSHLAERAHGSGAVTEVLDWFLDRPRIWIEGEVRNRFGAEVMQVIAETYRRHGAGRVDRLAVDAAFSASILAAVDAAPGYRPEHPVAPWIRGVAKNTTRDLCRVEETRALGLPLASPEVLGDLPDRAQPFVALEMEETRAWLRSRALCGSTAQGESAIVAHILDGDRSAEALGAELGLSVKRVYKRTAAARLRLRDAFERLYRG